MGKTFHLVRGVVKGAAIVVGAVTTFVCGMALLGRFVENGWIRAGGALVVMVVLPALVTDRLLPKDDPTRGRGLPSDVFALMWMGVPVLVAVALGSMTRGALSLEAERQARAGHGLLARLAMALSGRADGVTEPITPSPSASAEAASVSSLVAPSIPLPSGSAENVTPSGSATAPPESLPKKQTPGELTPAELFKKLAPAVVTIALLDEQGNETGGGTGFLLDRDGTTVTNHHVIDEARKIAVKFIDGAVYERVTVLVDDPTNDVALLRLSLGKPTSGKPPTFEPLKLGDSDSVVVGERAISIGNPLGLDHTLTDGLVSARRMMEGRPWIQMSVPVSPGNSGGPLFNMRGEVIGVTTAQLGGLFGRAQNLNLAIPAKIVAQHVQTNYPDARPLDEHARSSHW